MKKLLTLSTLLALLLAHAGPEPDLGPPEVENTYALETISIIPPAPEPFVSYGTSYIRRPIER